MQPESKTQIKAYLKIINKQAKKTIEWHKFCRWVRLHRILGTIDWLLVNKHTTKETEEILLRLWQSVKEIEIKMKSNVMPYKAFKIMLRPLKMINKNCID